MLVRLHLKTPHMVQKSSVELSLTVHALMLCWPAVFCARGPSAMVHSRGGLSCVLRLA